MRAVGINELLNKTFKSYDFDGVWRLSFGYPEKNFRAIVYGKSGNGKTDFCIKFAKYMATLGVKVYYNSFEEGISKTIQDAAIRNKLEEVKGKLIFGDKETFEEMMQRLKKRNSPQVVFIDSQHYINLTQKQYKILIDEFPRKAFVIVAWEANGKPKGEHAKGIEYMVDIKVHVRNFKAYPRCRFGGNVPFVIWDNPTIGNQQRRLF